MGTVWGKFGLYLLYGFRFRPDVEEYVTISKVWVPIVRKMNLECHSNRSNQTDIQKDSRKVTKVGCIKNKITDPDSVAHGRD